MARLSPHVFLPAGDKRSTLTSMFVFAMQHSGVPCDEAANRLGSWSGLMSLLVSGLSTWRASW